MNDKITPAIDSNFFYNFGLMLDFLSMTRNDFLEENPDVTEIQYNNTIIECLKTLNKLYYIRKPIFEIDGLYIDHLCEKMKIAPDFLLTICS